MSGVFDPDWVDPRTDTMPAQRPATFGEVWSANRVLARGDRMDAEAERLRREYEPLLTAVNADRERRGLKPMVNPGYWQSSVERRPSADTGSFDFSSLFDDRITRDQQQAAIFGEIASIRQRDPSFLKDVPDLPSFRKGMIDREKAARAGAREVLGRSSGVAQGAVGFAGGVWETMHDPVNIASMPLGGGGTTILAKVGRSALLNGGLELMQQPFVAENREVLGEELTLGEAGLNTLFGAVGGVAGDVVVPELAKLAGKGIGKAFDAAVPVDRRIASAISRASLDDASDADIAAAFARQVPRELRTPDESAALHVIERESEIRASSPFIPTVESLNAHAARMQSSMEAIVRANTADAVPIISPVVPPSPRARLRVAGGRLASDVVRFFLDKGYSEAHARGIAAGVAAEAASNHLARNPTSDALGLGQWLGPRKAELIRRYGPNPTRQQQLEFLHWELQGGDHGGRAVLRAGDEASVLSAYINDFMRPAKGAETTGDLSRGMAALGREMEDAARAIDIDMGAEGPIVRPVALDAERGAVARPDAELPEIDYADVPQLARDLFEDDATWAAAQDSHVEEALGIARDGADELPEVPPRRDDAQAPADAGQPRIDHAAEPPHISDQVAAVLEANGFERKGNEFTRVFENRAAPGAFSDGRRAVTVRMDESGRWLERLDGFDVARDVDLRSHPNDPIAAIRAVTDDADLPVDWKPASPDRTANAAAVPRAAAEPAPAVRDALAAEGFDVEPPASVPRQLDLFDEPTGKGATLQADSLSHDMRALLDADDAASGGQYRLEDGSEATLADILADIDEDEAMLATIRGCL